MDMTVSEPETLRVGLVNLKLRPMFGIAMSVDEAYRLCASYENGHEAFLREFLAELSETIMSHNLELDCIVDRWKVPPSTG